MLYRTSPECGECGESIPGKYRNMNPEGTLPQNMWIGDSFIEWDYALHRKECKSLSRDKNIEEILNKDEDED